MKRISFREISDSGNGYRPFSNEYLMHKEIFVEELDAKNRFLPIYLKEWSYGVSVEGTLTLKIRDGRENRVRILKKLAELFVPHMFLEQDRAATPGVEGRNLVYRKKRPELDPRDSMECWTFVLITNGKREEFIRRFARSIKNQKIPHTQFVLCGTIDLDIKDELESCVDEFLYIECRENESLGWITRKKNIGLSHSKYENVAVFHDRFILSDDWYQRMSEFGNTFEVLACANITETGRRISDWGVVPSTFERSTDFSTRFDLLRPYLLDPRDWHPSAYVSGGATIIKRSAWEMVPWDERRFWIEEEDVLLSNMQVLKGIVPRYAHSCRVVSLVNKNSKTRVVKFNVIWRGIGLVNALRDGFSKFIKRHTKLRGLVYRD